MIFSKIRHIFFSFGLSISLLVLFSACGKSKNQPKVKLSYQERRAVDTLYKERVIKLSPVLDSICDVNFDNNVQASIDSIVSKRREDEARLRNKIPIQR